MGYIMDILDKIELLEKQAMIVESGLQNMRDLAKQYKTAKVFFHKDLDGMTSAIAIKKYLEDNGVKVIDAEPIQYGSEEYTVKKTSPGVMNVLVDFAHGKTIMQIHTDHHDKQVGVDSATSTSFVHTPSNAEFISNVISTSNIFSQSDIDLISMVDNADFAKHGLEPDDIMRATFKLDKSLDVSKNKQMMGLVVNKLALTYKGKPEFLTKLVMTAKPSLMSMFNVIVDLAKKEGYKTPEEIESGTETYKAQRAGKVMDSGEPKDVPTMGNGQSFMFGNTVFQKGAGFMGKGNQYDRYTIFGLWPDAHYLVTQWPMGMIQVSGNPFSKLKNDHHLGDLVMKTVMPKFKSRLEGEKIGLDRVMWEFERDIAKKKIEGAVGFNWADFFALFSDKIKGMESKNDSWPNMIKDIADRPYASMSSKQKEILSKVYVSAWDVIMASSGGHKSITNISGLSFVKDTKDLMNDISIEILKMMKDKKLTSKEEF
jgi:hypothetical protein